MHNVRYTLGLLKKTFSSVQIKDFLINSSKNVSHLVKKSYRKTSYIAPYINYVTEV